jgi:glycosyltransferase involved in cell wall biosynthesis
MNDSPRGRIAIVRQTDHYELPVRREAEALARSGFDVEVLLMQRAGGPERETVDGVELTYLPASLRKSSKLRYVVDYARFFLRVMTTLTKRHLRRRYAVIQVNTMPDALVLSALVPKLLGARVVAYMHEPSPELAETILGPGLVPRVLAVVEQLVLRFADRAIAVTDQLRERYVERGARADKIAVVLNAPDPANRIGTWTPSGGGRAGDGTFTIICHGTVEDRYGQDTIVEAAAILRDELPQLRVVLVGRGKAVERLVRQISTASLDGVVQWEGWVTEERLNDLLHAADVGIVAQKASPYSHLVHTNKMIDFWIFGLPVIASRLRAVSDLYDDSVLEYYEPGDAADLARAIERLYRDPARRAELAANGRRAQEAYGWGVQRTRYLAVFDELLAK